MAEIYLLRHGQATFGSDNYDQLSPLGEQQSRLLGEYFRAANIDFDIMVRGAMHRHGQTLDGVKSSLEQDCPVYIDNGWNEYDHKALFSAYINEHPEDPEVTSSNIADYVHDRRLFYRILFRALPAWAEKKVEGATESWQEFQQRVTDAMDKLTQLMEQRSAKRALISASGGSLSLAIMLAARMPATQGIDLMRQMKNTALSQMFYHQGQWHLHSFNTLPHLSAVTQPELITYG